MNKSENSTKLYFNTRDELLRVDLKSTMYFHADRNYTDAYFANGNHAVLPVNLATVERLLDEEKLRDIVIPFVRLGRGLIVNVSYIFHINIPKQELVLTDNHVSKIYKLSVSREALKTLKELYVRHK